MHCHVLTLHLTFWETVELFYRVAAVLTFPLATCYNLSLWSCPDQSLWSDSSLWFLFAFPQCLMIFSICTCFLAFSMCILAIFRSFINISIEIIFPFLKLDFFCLLVSCRSSLHIVDTGLLIYKCFTNTFSQFVVCVLFIF